MVLHCQCNGVTQNCKSHQRVKQCRFDFDSQYESNPFNNALETLRPDPVIVDLISNPCRLWLVQPMRKDILSTPHWLLFLLWDVRLSNLVEVNAINAHFVWEFELLSDFSRNLITNDFFLILILIQNLLNLVFKLLKSCLMIKLLLCHKLNLGHSSLHLFLILVFFMELSFQ